MKAIILSWNNGDGARELAQALDVRLAKHGSTDALPSNRYAINLGVNTTHPLAERIRNSKGLTLLNSLGAVERAQSKVRTLQKLQSSDGSSPFVIPFETDHTLMAQRVLTDNVPYLARTLDRGSSGAGIEVITPESLLASQRIPRAQVYTRLIQKRREYRVHIGRTEGGACRVIDVCRKIRRPGVDDTNRPLIWNHENDFIFVRNGVNPDTVPANVLRAAGHAVHDLNLEFGAVDVIVQRGGPLREAFVYVLEVNTAPGMEGTTVERYAQYFRHRIEGTDFVAWAGNTEEFIEQEE